MFDTPFSRRAFLQGLLAIGASVVVPEVDASDEQVNEIWSRIVNDPVVFEVDEFNTITVPWVGFPERNSDVYYDIDLGLSTNQELLDQIESCTALSNEFAYRFECLADERNEGDEIDKLLTANKGWEDWVLIGNLEQLLAIAENWLDDGIQWDYAPATVGPVGEAYAYFNNFAWSSQEDLGVVVIEGEHPGSSYFAAELRVSVEEANQRASSMGLPIRFRNI